MLNLCCEANENEEKREQKNFENEIHSWSLKFDKAISQIFSKSPSLSLFHLRSSRRKVNKRQSLFDCHRA